MKELLKLCSEINDIYKKLYGLEFYGMMANSFFLQLVNDLKEKLKEEDRLFEFFCNSEEYEDVKESIMDDNNAIIMRVKDYITLYEAVNIGLEDNDEDDISEDEGLELKLGKLYSACARNIFLVYLSFLQECIDLEDDREIKNRLLSLKYYNSFTKHDIEKNLIVSNFKVLKENYVDLYLMCDILKINYNVFNDTVLDCYLSTIVDMIRQLLSINDNDRNDYNTIAVSKNALCLIRACFALLSDSDYERIKDSIMAKVDEFSNENNTFCCDLIENIIENRKHDKSRVRKISMRPIQD